MENTEILKAIDQMAFFLELGGENPFKVRAFQSAVRSLEEVDDIAAKVKKKQLNVPGVGKGILAFLEELTTQGSVKELNTIKKQFPETILEVRQVRGLGPKKIQTLFKELQIASLSELEYACQENRLIDLKGFGAKTQDNILKGVQFLQQQRGQVLLPHALRDAEEILKQVKFRAQIVGELRRHNECIRGLSFLVEGKEGKSFPKTSPSGLPIEWHFTNADNWGVELLRTTGPESFIEGLRLPSKAKTEEEVFKALAIDFIEPELRDQSISYAAKCSDLVTEKDIRGVFHFHTTESDGAHSLEEMIKAAIARGWEYVGVSEHSQSAVYARGLTPDRVLSQRKEVDKLQEKYPSIQIFHGIEADILSDGSLDYSDKILSQFDFVIGSVHSAFKMSREDMTKRLVRAAQNPYCTWIGHITGRLLLGRPGYDFDWEKVLSAAAKSGTGIELNANPYRLDIDWRILPEAKALGVSIGIFPDAHAVGGFEDVEYGVMMARKGGLSKADVTNAKSSPEMRLWLKK